MLNAEMRQSQIYADLENLLFNTNAKMDTILKMEIVRSCY
jgi:hypothetical protein